MKNYFIIIQIALFFFFQNILKAQYSPQSPYLKNPSLAIGYVDSCARFWIRTYDNNRGGFYTNIDKFGNVITGWGTNKNMLTQSRNVYGLVRGFMMTGDTSYINLAGKALNWMYDHAWDKTNGGWFQELDVNGNPVNQTSIKSAFYAHYALLGIIAYYEATRDTTAWNWLIKGYEHLENFYWDNREGYKGYYDQTNYNNSSPVNKSFNATVDAVTTHLLYLYLITREERYKERLLEMAVEMKLHLAASMPLQAIGFVENFDSNWNWRGTETMTLMGHVLKTAWCLARINQLFPDTSYVNTAKLLVKNVWDKGYDHVYGGPYKDFNRVTGEMLLWGLGDSAKAWWQMEQAVVAGLQLYNLTNESVYLEMSDESLNFFMNYFVDHQNGEVYSDRTRRGGFAWNEAKASSGKAGYHSIELGYYTYLYGSFFLTKESIALKYLINPLSYDREIYLTPLAIPDAAYTIGNVTLNGENYTNGISPDGKLIIPQNIGGLFAVQFLPIISDAADEIFSLSDYNLSQNYPNPFNSSTKISYTVPKRGQVIISVYDVLGEEAGELINEVQEAGTHSVLFNASSLSSGVYLYRISADNGNFIQTRKMILLK